MKLILQLNKCHCRTKTGGGFTKNALMTHSEHFEFSSVSWVVCFLCLFVFQSLLILRESIGFLSNTANLISFVDKRPSPPGNHCHSKAGSHGGVQVRAALAAALNGANPEIQCSSQQGPHPSLCAGTVLQIPLLLFFPVFSLLPHLNSRDRYAVYFAAVYVAEGKKKTPDLRLRKSHKLEFVISVGWDILTEDAFRKVCGEQRFSHTQNWKFNFIIVLLKSIIPPF